MNFVIDACLSLHCKIIILSILLPSKRISLERFSSFFWKLSCSLAVCEWDFCWNLFCVRHWMLFNFVWIVWRAQHLSTLCNSTIAAGKIYSQKWQIQSKLEKWEWKRKRKRKPCEWKTFEKIVMKLTLLDCVNEV